ncbi:hypothetical protein FK220_018260 [Flavobacteriaceae bacterium TP-CH-4]|uniref:Uncharacterized protein n=1 Tax=Pelagihabitans pacificus TaxID=2696054 RepID=A0A967AY42_9FLAO|nr:hypothetical protein [Pelagihabitans pacificus]NHF61303.1 hypothetical protein [Pelagihabitans pacificus]
MMDELELLKKDWQKKDELMPKLSYDEIHKMTWKKSSSIVKWILIISILEFTLPHLLYILPSSRDVLSVYQNNSMSPYFVAMSIFSYSIALYFIFQFYRRYREISVLDNSKNLMRKIIKTRRTVKNYIIFSLSMVLVMVIVIVIGIYLNNDFLSDLDFGEKAKDVSPEKLKLSLMMAVGIVGVLLTFAMGVIYFLLYGLLLRKLKKNYTELRRLEV